MDQASSDASHTGPGSKPLGSTERTDSDQVHNAASGTASESDTARMATSKEGLADWQVRAVWEQRDILEIRNCAVNRVGTRIRTTQRSHQCWQRVAQSPSVRTMCCGIRTGAVSHAGLQHSLHDLYHRVQRVGLDTAASPPYWKVRDSWGTDWSEAGSK